MGWREWGEKTEAIHVGVREMSSYQPEPGPHPVVLIGITV